MKTYKFKMFILLTFLCLGSCKSQYFSLGQSGVESTFPYNITYPDKLKMSQDLFEIADSGNLVLHIYINDDGELKDLDIVLASLFKNGDRVLRFSNPSLEKSSLSNYPSELIKFYTYFHKQIEKFKVVPKKDVGLEGEYLLRVPLTFGKP